MKPAIARWLGLAGLIPFIGLALIVISDVAGLAAPAGQALRVYAALILSFLGGVSWGIALRHEHEGMFSLSMLPFFGAWAALLLSGPASYACLIVSFLAAHAIDHAAERNGLLPDGFLKLRRQLTLVVIVCLVTVAMSL